METVIGWQIIVSLSTLFARIFSYRAMIIVALGWTAFTFFFIWAHWLLLLQLASTWGAVWIASSFFPDRSSNAHEISKENRQLAGEYAHDRLLPQNPRTGAHEPPSVTEPVVNLVSSFNELVRVGKSHSEAYLEATKAELAANASRRDAEREAEHLKRQKEISARYKKAYEDLQAMGVKKIYSLEDGPITVEMMKEALGYTDTEQNQNADIEVKKINKLEATNAMSDGHIRSARPRSKPFIPSPELLAQAFAEAIKLEAQKELLDKTNMEYKFNKIQNKEMSGINNKLKTLGVRDIHYPKKGNISTEITLKDDPINRSAGNPADGIRSPQGNEAPLALRIHRSKDCSWHSADGPLTTEKTPPTIEKDNSKQLASFQDALPDLQKAIHTTLPAPTSSPPSSFQRSIVPGAKLITRAANDVAIRQFVQDLGIPHLVHFTRSENLPGILKHGLLSVEACSQRNVSALRNDGHRYDGQLGAISLSITFPNYRMFYKYRRLFPTADWAVLLIHPRVLWENNCAFYPENAANAAMIRRPQIQARSPQALAEMFSTEHGPRADWLRPFDPTDSQAEVMVHDPIEPQTIEAIAFETSTSYARHQYLLGGIESFYTGPGKGLFASRRFARQS